MGIAQKMLNIMAKVDRIPKNGWNDFHKYAYPLDADVLEYMRKILVEEQVIFWYTILETRKDVNITKAKFEMTFEDVESGEKRTAVTEGEGEDKGDKGIYKAITGAIKYFLLKEFLVPTGDDPERDDGARKDDKSQPQQNNRRGKSQSGKRNSQQQQSNNDQKSGTQSDKQPVSQKPDPQATQKAAMKQKWVEEMNSLAKYAEECGLTRDELIKQGNDVTKKTKVNYWTIDDMKTIRTHIENIMSGISQLPERDAEFKLPDDDDLPF